MPRGSQDGVAIFQLLSEFSRGVLFVMELRETNSVGHKVAWVARQKRGIPKNPELT